MQPPKCQLGLQLTIIFIFNQSADHFHNLSVHHVVKKMFQQSKIHRFFIYCHKRQRGAANLWIEEAANQQLFDIFA